MWKLEIYPSLLNGAPIERHTCEGSLGAWLDACGIEWKEVEEQPIIVSLDSLSYPVSEWEKELPTGSILKIRVIPRKSVFRFIGKLFSKLFGIKTPKTMTNNSQTQKSLEAADVTANTAKLGEVVPEIAGTYRKYPDYLVQPHRYFLADDPRTQVVEFHACIGPGFYNIPPESVKLGNTPFTDIGEDRGSYKIYSPNESTTAGGATTNQNWYSSPEVGSTSNGTAGIELLAEVVNFSNTDSLYTVSGATSITRTSGTWPASWTTGVIVSIAPVYNYSMNFTRSYRKDNVKPDGRMRVYRLYGNFKHILPLPTSTPTNPYFYFMFNPNIRVEHLGLASWAFDAVVSFTSLDVNGDGYIDVDSPTNIEDSYIVNSPFRISSSIVAYKLTINSTTVAVAQRVLKYSAAADPYNYASWSDDSSWTGFRSGSLNSPINYIITNNYGVYSSSFATAPAGELTDQLELDFFFPSGLAYIDGNGNPTPLAVQLQVSITSEDGTYSLDEPLTYTGSTVDQIGFTKKYVLPYKMRPTVRVRRNTKTNSGSSFNDKVVWYGLKSLLENRTHYPNWTTIGVKMRSGGKLGQGSESQINVLATRLLPTLNNNTLNQTYTASREISSFFTYIAQTAGYDLSQLDLVELNRLEDIWRTRGDTFNYVFDQTTVKDALDLTLNAGFAQTTVEDGILKPVRNNVRTQFEQAYSPQNMVEPLVRKFQAHAPDDADGVEVDYMDGQTWTRKTLVCALPGSDKARLEKIKVEGVTDRTRAWRLGMRRMYELMYSRWSYSFTTELDAMCSNYLSYVPLFDDLPQYQQSALSTSFVYSNFGGSLGPGYIISVTEPIDRASFAGADITVAFRGRNGKVSPYFKCRPVPLGPEPSSDYQFVVAGTDFSPFQSWLGTSSGVSMEERSSRNFYINDGEPIHVYIGRSDRFCFPALITAIKPGDGSKVSVTAINYDARVYQADDSAPPPEV